MEVTDEQFQRSAGGRAGVHHSGLSRHMDGGESTSSCCPCGEKNTVGTSKGKSGRLLLLNGVVFQMREIECSEQYAPCF